MSISSSCDELLGSILDKCTISPRGKVFEAEGRIQTGSYDCAAPAATDCDEAFHSPAFFAGLTMTAIGRDRTIVNCENQQIANLGKLLRF